MTAVVCLGGANVDRKLRVVAPVRPGSSNPATARETFGGVARNVAENLARCGVPVQLLAAVGQDAAGRALLDDAAQAGIDVHAVQVIGGALTGSYTAVLDTDGSLYVALAHMDLCERLTPDWLAQHADVCRGAALVVADLNLPVGTLAALVTAAAEEGAPPLVLVAVSEAKMDHLPLRLCGVRLLVLNRGELAAWAGTDALADGMARLQAAGVRDVVVTLGEAGLCHTAVAGALVFLAAPVVPAEAVVDVTGAGDALAAGLCHGLWTGAVADHGWSPTCVQALARAAWTVQCAETVLPGTESLPNFSESPEYPERNPMSDPLMRFSDEVQAARDAGRPIVALESTIIAHGMPWPQNVETAREVEAIIRARGATPATIAVLGGQICIGLSDAQLEQLGRDPDVMKLSRRDLPYAVAMGRVGATTVAATMVCAARAGIEVFVTGGIGGVHRGAAESFDISADLQELARTPVAVVCAGAKSVLDLPLTLEYLETHGVPVVGVGQDRFAAFYSRDSGLPCDFRIDAPADQARFVRTKWALGLGGGVVFSNPVPLAHEIPPAEIEAITRQALDEAAACGVSGKRVTPFLLGRIKELTEGRSLVTNIALVKHNAQVGADLAIALARS